MHSAPIVSIVGRTNSGKTTLLEKLIPELSRRGHRVGIVKHHAHAGFEVDRPGKDTWRLAKAGAHAVALVSPGKMFLVRETDGEMSVEQVRNLLGEVDIVLAEGFHFSATEKIEIVRSDNNGELLCSPDELAAVVTDLPASVHGKPRIDIDDVEGLADFLETRYLGRHDKP